MFISANALLSNSALLKIKDGLVANLDIKKFQRFHDDQPTSS